MTVTMLHWLLALNGFMVGFTAVALALHLGA